MDSREKFDGWRCVRDDACSECPVSNLLNRTESVHDPEDLVRKATFLPIFQEILDSTKPEDVGKPGSLTQNNLKFLSQKITESEFLLGNELINALKEAMTDPPESCNQLLTRSEVSFPE